MMVWRGRPRLPMRTMKGNAQASLKPPLLGIRVLVGRARHQVSGLSAELRKLGATMIEIPFIEIRKPKSFKALDAALRSLAEYDWLILTSVNGVEAMWERLTKLRLPFASIDREDTVDREDREDREGHGFSRAANHDQSNAALAARRRRLRIAAIGPATKKAIERRHVTVDVVPKEYVAESVVRSLRRRVKGKRVLLVRAKVARDVIPRELRKAGAHVDVVEAYETVVPKSSRRRLQNALQSPRLRPHIVTFTSSSTAKNFVELLRARGKRNAALDGILTASIGPVTSSTLLELGLRVDIAAKEFTIPGLVDAIVRSKAQLASIR